MAKAWQQLNLEGGGLQAVNTLLAAQMRSRTRAYAFWLLFPLGLHRFYLEERRGGVMFPLLSLVTTLAVWLAPASWWLAPAAALLGYALHDLFWIDRKVTSYNKALRMQLFLRKGRTAPRDYRGRYTDDAEAEAATEDLQTYQTLKERERAGHLPRDSGAGTALDPGRSRQPSFNEQEAMLRELAKRRKQRGEGSH